MRTKNVQRVSVLAAATLLTCSAMILSTGSAAAASWTYLDTGYGVGLYNQYNTSGGKVGAPDLFPGNHDGIYATCWIVGQSINVGNIWYRTIAEWYGSIGTEIDWVGWTYGGYVDGNGLFRSGTLPRC
ncbi:hypothetical protein [Nocardia heshunensis]